MKPQGQEMLVATKEILKPLATRSGRFSPGMLVQSRLGAVSVFRYFAVSCARPAFIGESCSHLKTILDVWRSAGVGGLLEGVSLL